MLTQKYIDVMTDSQDVAGHPLSLAEKEIRCQKIKDLGATGVAVSTPYNVPSGFPDPLNQTHEWITAAEKFGLKVQLRQSWDDDEGWYGVPKQTSNNRIADTADWILKYNTKYPNDLKNVEIFTPKPEPQNMGIMGVNTGSNARFKNKAEFNLWLRDMMSSCKVSFGLIGLTPKIGHWGFDGFITCGYQNPDHEGKSVLEPATVQAMGNQIAIDHYPSSKPMSDFIRVFNQTWPNVKFDVSEYGTTLASDKPGQLKKVLDDCLASPMFSGFFNYWNLDGGPDVAILTNGIVNLTGQMLKSFYEVTTPPIPIPPSKSNTIFVHLKGTQEYGFYVPATNEESIKDKALNFGLGITHPDGSVNFDSAIDIELKVVN